MTSLPEILMFRDEADSWDKKMELLLQKVTESAKQPVDPNVNCWILIGLQSSELGKFSVMLVSILDSKAKLQGNLDNFVRNLRTSKADKSTFKTSSTAAVKIIATTTRDFESSQAIKRQKLSDAETAVKETRETYEVHVANNSPDLPNLQNDYETSVQRKNAIVAEIANDVLNHEAALIDLKEKSEAASAAYDDRVRVVYDTEKCLKAAKQAMAFLESAENKCREALSKLDSIWFYLANKLKTDEVRSINGELDINTLCSLTSFTEQVLLV